MTRFTAKFESNYWVKSVISCGKMTQITGCVVWFYFISPIKMRKGKTVMGYNNLAKPTFN